MASAAKTPKLALPQWVAAEKPERTDFNAAFLTLDGIFNLMYPVGSIYTSVAATNPGTLFGGTWVAFAAGRVLVGINAGDTQFDVVEETGGAKTHTLIKAELPVDYYDVKMPGSLGGTNSLIYGDYVGGGAIPFARPQTSTDGASFGNPAHIGPLGSGIAHNNLQPYLTVYMFKRLS